MGAERFDDASREALDVFTFFRKEILLKNHIIFRVNPKFKVAPYDRRVRLWGAFDFRDFSSIYGFKSNELMVVVSNCAAGLDQIVDSEIGDHPALEH